MYAYAQPPPLTSQPPFGQGVSGAGLSSLGGAMSGPIIGHTKYHQGQKKIIHLVSTNGDAPGRP